MLSVILFHTKYDNTFFLKWFDNFNVCNFVLVLFFQINSSRKLSWNGCCAQKHTKQSCASTKHQTLKMMFIPCLTAVLLRESRGIAYMKRTYWKVNTLSHHIHITLFEMKLNIVWEYFVCLPIVYSLFCKSHFVIHAWIHLKINSHQMAISNRITWNDDHKESFC